MGCAARLGLGRFLTLSTGRLDRFSDRASSATGLDEGGLAGDRAADDEGVHLAGALIAVDGLGICEIADDVVVEDDAIASEKFAAPGDRLPDPAVAIEPMTRPFCMPTRVATLASTY